MAENKGKQLNQEEMCNIPDGIIRTLKEDVADIKSALLGTRYQKKGLIERVESIEYRLEELQKLKWQIYGGAAVITVAISAAFRLVLEVIPK